MLTNIKIDNMRLQFAGKKAAAKKEQEEDTYVAVDPDTEFGFVAVAVGDGVSQLFSDLGVNQVVSGGQTMNPSTCLLYTSYEPKEKEEKAHGVFKDSGCVGDCHSDSHRRNLLPVSYTHLDVYKRQGTGSVHQIRLRR